MRGPAESICEYPLIVCGRSRNRAAVDAEQCCLEAWSVLNRHDSRFACHLAVLIVPKAVGIDHDTVGVVRTNRLQFQRLAERVPAAKATRILYRQGGSTKPGQIQIANVNAKLPFAIALSH